MTNTMENTRSLRMDMPSIVAQQPHGSIPATKMKDESVSVTFRLIRLGYSSFSRVCFNEATCAV
jgi:hypothetical protein